MDAKRLSPSALAGFAGNVVNWYWTHGSKRKSSYTLSTGSWLNAAYRIQKSATRASLIPSSSRKILGIWGPSQSGKSTLLSQFIDQAHRGMRSALQWSSFEPVEFVGEASDTTKLNPYNYKNDGSGCVTRYSLQETVDDPEHPVEVILATPDQILQAFAIGYLSECQGGWDERTWTGSDIFTLLEKTKGGGPKRRDAYEILHDFTLVLDDLILARWPRYSGIRLNWPAVKTAILENEALLASELAAKSFVAAILWDGEMRFVELFDELIDIRRKYLAMSKRMFGSYAFAARILDISAAENFDSFKGPPLAYRQTADKVLFGTTSAAASSFAPNALTFAKFQALIWELRVPLNAAILRETSPEIAQTLAATEIIDFPGVSNTGEGGAKKQASEFDTIELFTGVFKRGKTASIVVSYADSMAIDGFALLMRAQVGLAQPRQLIAGLAAWVEGMGYTYPPSQKEPPLNIILTFCSSLVNDVANSLKTGRPTESAQSVFNWFDSIGDVANTRWARFWATTYPRFERKGGEGMVKCSASEAADACDLLMRYPGYSERFGHDSEMLHRMSRAALTSDGDGAVTSVFANVCRSLEVSTLEYRRTERLERFAKEIAALLDEALPGEHSSQSQKATDIESWKKQILDSISVQQTSFPDKDAVATIAASLMRVLTISGDDLDVIPTNASTANLDGYVEQQIRVKWFDHARELRGDLELVGLYETAAANRRLEYLADHLISHGKLPAWLKLHLGRLERIDDRRHTRRYLALKISDLLLYGSNGVRRTHRAIHGTSGLADEVFRSLAGYAEREASGAFAVEGSVHLKAVIEPFFSNLGDISRASSRVREPQVGDAEMSVLQREFAL